MDSEMDTLTPKFTWCGEKPTIDPEDITKNLEDFTSEHIADTIKDYRSNDFSYNDQVLDITAMVVAVPPKYKWSGEEISFKHYISVASGNAALPAREMTKWFHTNSHYISPELSPEIKFPYVSHKAVEEFKEAKELGIHTVPVIVELVSYLLLSKPAKVVPKTFDLLSLLDSILPIYKSVLWELKAAGVTLMQLDESSLFMDLESHQLEAFTKAYSYLEATDIKLLVETYFSDIPVETYKTIIRLKGISAIGFDLVRGSQTLSHIKEVGFPYDKTLNNRVVDGMNIWANDLAASISILENLENIFGKDKLVVSTSYSLMHTVVDVINETKLDSEIKSWLAFAGQKLIEEYFTANSAAQASRRSSPRVTNEAVQKAASEFKPSDHRRTTPANIRLEQQQKKLNLALLSITTIGLFPQTPDLRRVPREFKTNKIDDEEYVSAMKEEIAKVNKLQKEIGIDVLVHGEPERNDVVEYFGEQLEGFTSSANGGVQSYGLRCVNSPFIYGDVSRPKPITVFWSKMAQSMTARPMKGMLTAPVTILNWSFVRNDQSRSETCMQIAVAILDEVEYLEAGGIQVIQIDEAALREGLPLRKAEHAYYLDWTVHVFRITICAVKDTTQIHTHRCYSNFNDIIHSIIRC